MVGWLQVIPDLAPWLVLAQDQGGGEGGSMLWDFPWIPFVIIGVMFYLLLIRPERRKRAEMAMMMDNLKKNDRIVTIGGIHGVVVNVTKGSEDVTIRVDEASNARLRILRSAISRVVADEDADVKNDLG